jgi:hypothetical protein
MFVFPSGIEFDRIGSRDHYRPFRRGGPFDEKMRPPFDVNAFGTGHRRTQQPQPAGWATFVPRSVEATRLRQAEAMPARLGAPSEARGALQPQIGQTHGSRNSAIGRIAVNVPHSWHSYS